MPVDAATAEAYGLINPDDEETARNLSRDGSIAIPRWRHALINFPHPLLKQGLVILDTPGLNAIGTEPELTLSMLPNAHAVLFLLAADTGVTKSDIEIWHHHIAPVQGANRARLVVLNKIDGLWDELKTQVEIDAEITKQAASSAALLDLPIHQVYPVSAQKALVAKVRNDRRPAGQKPPARTGSGAVAGTDSPQAGAGQRIVRWPRGRRRGQIHRIAGNPARHDPGSGG